MTPEIDTARCILFGCTSIYILKNFLRLFEVGKDFDAPSNLLLALRNLIIRQRNNKDLFLTPVSGLYLEHAYSAWYRMKNYIPKLSIFLNSESEEMEKFDSTEKDINFHKNHFSVSDMNPTQPTVRLHDIKGYGSVKEELLGFVSSLQIETLDTKNQGGFTRGCILYGPPIFERSLLVHGLAVEMKMCLFDVSNISLDGSFYCNGQKINQVQEFVNQVTKFSPCLLFFDNYDCCVSDNSGFLSSLIVELDKWNDISRIAIIVGTSILRNIPRDVANLSRFGNIVQLEEKLNFNKRKDIFMHHLSTIPVDSTLDVDLMVRATEGLTAEQIKYLINRSARKAKLQNRTKITTQDICYTLLMVKMKRFTAASFVSSIHPQIPPRKKTNTTTCKMIKPTSK